jgi:hypothetical protein
MAELELESHQGRRYPAKEDHRHDAVPTRLEVLAVLGPARRPPRAGRGGGPRLRADRATAGHIRAAARSGRIARDVVAVHG